MDLLASDRIGWTFGAFRGLNYITGRPRGRMRAVNGAVHLGVAIPRPFPVRAFYGRPEMAEQVSVWGDTQACVDGLAAVVDAGARFLLLITNDAA